MSGNVKFRWFLLAPILVALFVVISPVVSWSGELEDAQKKVRQNPNDADAHYNLGVAYNNLGQHKEAIRIKPDDAKAHNNLGVAYNNLGQYQEAIASYKEAIRIKPDNATAHNNLGWVYKNMDRNDEAIASYKEALRINPDLTIARNNLNKLEQKTADERLAREQRLLGEEREKHDALQKGKEADRLARERKLLEEERKKLEAAEERQRQQQAQQQPVPGGTGFLFSSKDYIITNYHVVKGKHAIKAKFTNGDVIEADIVSKDVKNDIAILKLKTSSSITSRELKFGDSSKARMGEKVFTIGYPASSVLGERPKYTEGVISAVTGIKDDPTVFQITVPIQPGNSGGPLFNEKGEIIGITTASLSLRAAEVLGAIPQNINYALKSSFVKNLLASIPESLLSNRGIVVVPKDPQNSLADFIEAVTRNVVLIEAKE